MARIKKEVRSSVAMTAAMKKVLADAAWVQGISISELVRISVLEKIKKLMPKLYRDYKEGNDGE